VYVKVDKNSGTSFKDEAEKSDKKEKRLVGEADTKVECGGTTLQHTALPLQTVIQMVNQNLSRRLGMWNT
jgi:hypothetical protein